MRDLQIGPVGNCANKPPTYSLLAKIERRQGKLFLIVNLPAIWNQKACINPEQP